MHLFALWLGACAPPDSNPAPPADPVVGPPDAPVPPELTLAIDAPTTGIRDLRCAATVAEGEVTAWRWRNLAASIVVRQFGTTPTTPGEMKAALELLLEEANG